MTQWPIKLHKLNLIEKHKVQHLRNNTLMISSFNWQTKSTTYVYNSPSKI